MRYQTDQPLVSRLIEALEVETRPFESLDGDNRLVLRGAFRRRLTPASHVPTRSKPVGTTGARALVRGT